ncbi:general odorant-binding protein 84a isoform X1 [Drosophila sulfurigaster albostrigata]|uniref:general odorant-binding protein 84a isoform X1 n=1 Tax=Drosophila sulfurigaster albostrigata TaxID=89887 RepID=UPI002D21BE35|nr:general odorant-binding protein 84a isoform X1 [Drosophila sulfurigaster albostrigata]
MAHFNFFILLLTMSVLFWSVLHGQDVQPEPDDPEVQRVKHAEFFAARKACALEFLVPYANTILFNTTGKLLDENDRTSMCYFRCFFEKAGLMDNFKLNVELVRKYLWPATGDSIEHCESQAMDETNACVRAYAITQCIMMRALTDARNKPMV